MRKNRTAWGRVRGPETGTRDEGRAAGSLGANTIVEAGELPMNDSDVEAVARAIVGSTAWSSFWDHRGRENPGPRRHVCRPDAQ